MSKSRQINTQNIQSQPSCDEVVTQRTTQPQTESTQNMEKTKQALPPSDPKEAPYNPLHRNEDTSAHTITVDTTLKGKAQTPKDNGDDIQIDNSLTGMIVDTEGPQDTQAEIMGNNKRAEANPPPSPH